MMKLTLFILFTVAGLLSYAQKSDSSSLFLTVQQGYTQILSSHSPFYANQFEGKTRGVNRNFGIQTALGLEVEWDRVTFNVELSHETYFFDYSYFNSSYYAIGSYVTNYTYDIQANERISYLGLKFMPGITLNPKAASNKTVFSAGLGFNVRLNREVLGGNYYFGTSNDSIPVATEYQTATNTNVPNAVSTMDSRVMPMISLRSDWKLNDSWSIGFAFISRVHILKRNVTRLKFDQLDVSGTLRVSRKIK